MSPDSDPGAPATAGPAPDVDLLSNLLSLIEAGEVVPVVGRDLLWIGPPERRVHLYASVAAKVAQDLKVSFDLNEPSKDPLNTVACRYLAAGGDARNIYQRIFHHTKQLPQDELPDALLKLAAIDPFKLFVTTMFDDSLRAAIDRVRFNRIKTTDTCAFAPKKSDDLRRPLKEVEKPIVFHLLGKLSPSDDFVVTEEDALEFVHWLHKSPPSTLFDELYQKNLLVIGCRFPAWLVRSVIRLARSQRLLFAQSGTVFVVDSGAREDRTLIDFFRTFKTRAEVFERVDPIDFVDKLHAHWQQRAPAPAAIEAEGLPPPGAIFISYASEDRGVAEQVAAALRDAKLEVWFDRTQIMGGDRFMERIQTGIKRADLFLPLLSRRCLVRESRYFRHEWDAAILKAKGLPGSVRFLYPVAIDDIPPAHEDIPGEFSSASWVSIAGGLTADFSEQVKARYKKNQ